MNKNSKYAGNPTDKNKSSNPQSATPYKRKYGLAKLLEEVDPFFLEEGELEKLQAEHDNLERLFQDMPAIPGINIKDFIAGEVSARGKEGFYINIGQKYDAFVPEDQAEGLSIGQTAEFYVTGGVTNDGLAVISYTAAIGWKELVAEVESENIFTAQVFSPAYVRRTQEISGLRVIFTDGPKKGIRGFIPKAQLSRGIRANDSAIIGQSIPVCVLVADPHVGGGDGGNLVVSNRKAQTIIEDSAFDQIEEGMILTGTVCHFLKASEKDQSFSALVHLENGLTSMLHRSEVAKPGDDLTKLYKVGSEITVAVCKKDVEKRRISLSLRYADYINCLNSLETDQTVIAEVLRKVPYGYFVSINGGVMEGLIHESDLKVVDGQKETLKSGDKVEVVVLDFNPDGSRLSLGRKQLA